MECRLVQVPSADDIHLAWCSTGQVLLALDEIEKTEKIQEHDGPGVEGYAPLYLGKTLERILIYSAVQRYGQSKF